MMVTSSKAIFGYYHRVQPADADQASKALAVAPESLRRHILALQAAGFAMTTASDAAGSATAAGGAARRAAAITFDDGFVDNHELALPMMSGLGAPGTVFVIASTLAKHGHDVAADRLDTGSAAVPEHRSLYLGLPALRSLLAAGWEIGSHALEHRKLTEMDESAQRRQLLESRLRLEDLLGVRVRSVAYPFGLYDPTTLRVAEEAGYDFGFTTAARGGAASPYAIPRLSLGGYGFRAWKQRLKLRLAMAMKA
jgi:peptidoglycan/xylan/chitin deacetylase (PgdA/CDA1 family)